MPTQLIETMSFYHIGIDLECLMARGRNGGSDMTLRTLCLRMAVMAVATFGFFMTSSQAALIIEGEFSGNDCGGAGGFAACRATIEGTQQGGEEGSPTIYKRNFSDGTEDFGIFPTIDGEEFTLTLVDNVLSWTYTPDDPEDPAIHYFTIKQGNGFYLLYDLDNPIYSYSANILTEFGYNGLSHVTWFDTGRVDGVPEPGTLGLLGLGLLSLGAALRRGRRRAIADKAS